MTENELRETISGNIKRIRTQRAMNQLELAEKAEITDKFISAIETGRQWCSLEKLLAIANALSVDPYELLLPQNTGVSYDAKRTRQLMRQLHKNFDDVITTLENFLIEK